MTTPPVLKSLTLKSFRGSSGTFKIKFEKDRKLTLVYGENGCGKTTICDAFQFLSEERLGSLEKKGMGQGLEKYWHSAGKTQADLEVLLETSSGQCEGRLINGKTTIGPTSGKPKIELLRRQQILDLIEAQPADRYKAIKQFIDIDLFERSEETLRQLAKGLPGEAASARDREGESLTALMGFFEAAGKPPGDNPVSWAKKQLAQSIDQMATDLAAIKTLIAQFDELIKLPQKLSQVAEIEANARSDLAGTDDALGAALSASVGGDGDLLNLFESGKAFLHAHPDHASCPLCDSADKFAGLADRIQSGLSALAQIKKATVSKQGAEKRLAEAKTLLEAAKKDFANKKGSFTTLVADTKWRPEVKLPSPEVPENMDELPAWLKATAIHREEWSKLESEWGSSETLRKALKTSVDQYDSNLRSRMELEALIPKIEKALEACVKERQAFTDDVMSAIAGAVGKLYEKVHPGEGLDKIALPLDPKKRASIELEAKFAGKDVPPQAYFSQSHLDTLGLCVFLALALRNQPDGTILILDDVLGSVDEPHVERVIQMIYEVSKEFVHTVVTTHYRPWREKYRWGWLKPDQPCQFVELGTWTIDDGLKDVGSLPEIERLKALLQETPIDTQSLCSKAGVILEAALDFLTQRFECSVPRRFGSAYTLGDLIPAITKKLRDALAVDKREMGADGKWAEVRVDLKPILDVIENVAQVRNALGAHFKAISFDLLDADAVRFAEQVVMLMDALTHPEHGWPNNDKSGSYWRNSGDTRRLHPLKKPS